MTLGYEPCFGLDGSTSMNDQVAPNSFMSKKAFGVMIAKTFVTEFAKRDTRGGDEKSPNGNPLGGLLMLTYSDRAHLIAEGHMNEVYKKIYPDVLEANKNAVSSDERVDPEEHAGDVNSYNYDEMMKYAKWGGGTIIMNAVRVFEAHYKEEFVDNPDGPDEEDRPALMLTFATDGENADNSRFVEWLASNDHAYANALIIGEDEGAYAALNQWKKTMERNPRVFVEHITMNTDLKDLANRLFDRMQ